MVGAGGDGGLHGLWVWPCRCEAGCDEKERGPCRLAGGTATTSRRCDPCHQRGRRVRAGSVAPAVAGAAARRGVVIAIFGVVYLYLYMYLRAYVSISYTHLLRLGPVDGMSGLFF
jgi:hypothetical protein